MKLSTALERVLCPRIHFKMMIFDHKTGKSSGVILCVRILKFILVGITVRIKGCSPCLCRSPFKRLHDDEILAEYKHFPYSLCKFEV